MSKIIKGILDKITAAVISFLVTFSLLFLPAAEPQNLEVQVANINAGSTSISYTCINNTNRSVVGIAYVKSFEKNVDGEWVQLQYFAVYEEIATVIRHGGSFKDGFRAEEPLTAGEYRFTLEYTVHNTEVNTNYKTVYFTVTEA